MALNIDVAIAGAIGALGGSALSPLIGVVQDSVTSRRENRRHMQDVRRDSYGDAIAWLFSLRNRVYSLSTFLLIATHGSPEEREYIRPTVDEEWKEVQGLVMDDLSTALGPMLRVSSNRVMVAYRSLSSTSTFWPNSYGPHVHVLVESPELDRQLKGVRYKAPQETGKLIASWPTRPQTPEEEIKSRTNGSQSYMAQIDDFIHLLRQEIGLSRGHRHDYLQHGGELKLRARFHRRRLQIGRLLVRVRARLTRKSD